MKKDYCDGCGVEIANGNRFSHEASVEVADVEFHISYPDAMPIDYDVCKYCVIDAIKALDDRPREMNIK